MIDRKSYGFGFDSSGIVPIVDDQEIEAKATALSGGECPNTEFIESLGRLHDLGKDLVEEHHTMPVANTWGTLLAPDPQKFGTRQERREWSRNFEKSLTPDLKHRLERFRTRIPWVLDADQNHKKQAIKAANDLCIATRGQAVLVMVRHPAIKSDQQVQKRREALRRRHPGIQLAPGKADKVAIVYQVMLIVPRPVKTHEKPVSGVRKRYLDWHPKVVQAPKGKLYEVSTSSERLFHAEPDAYDIDLKREILKLDRVMRDLAKELDSHVSNSREDFRVEQGFFQARASQRGFATTGGWVGPIEIVVGIAAGLFFALHGIHF